MAALSKTAHCAILPAQPSAEPRAQFGTDFKMMDADAGRQQTTQGIWLDVSPKVAEVPTLVMDLEGSDGRERGEDDTSFERQSALFALATADVLLINMFAVNIGRVQGSGAPMLKTVFQARARRRPRRMRCMHAHSLARRRTLGAAQRSGALKGDDCAVAPPTPHNVHVASSTLRQPRRSTSSSLSRRRRARGRCC